MSRIRIAIAALSIIVIGMIVQQLRWSGEKGARRAHSKFLERIENKSWGKCHRMISRTYSDRWNFDNGDISLALRDVAGEFIINLDLEWQEQSISESDGAFEISGLLRLDGRGSPAVPIIIREFKGYASKPFEFRWRKSGMLPWSWKLESIDHPTVEPPSGYQPGKLSEMTSPF